MSRKCDVRTPEQALVYITDCCLATVSSRAMLKSRGKSEFQRQIEIAQSACTWIKEMHIDPTGSRADDIVGKQTVAEWVKRWIM